jgi:small subunit ribosomal protein S14
MAKKSSIERNVKRQQLVQKYLARRTYLKSQMKASTSLEEKLNLHQLLQSLPRNSSPNRVYSRCNITGRPRSVYRHFGLSRHVLREMAHDCVLPGLVKSSW